MIQKYLIAGMFLIAVSISVEATLLLHYTFDESASGNSAALDSGQAPATNGTFNGSSTRVGTTPGGYSLGAMSTAGGAGTNYLTTGGTPAKINGLTNFTLATWINLRSNPGIFDRIISMHSAGGSGDGFDFFIEDDHATSFSRNDFSLSLVVDSVVSITSVAIQPTNQWLFLAVTYSGTNASSNVRYYWGTESQSVAQIGSTGNLNAGVVDITAADFRVGGTARSGLDRTPDAWFDDVRVYSEVLSSGDLENVRQANLIPEPSALALMGCAGLLVSLLRRGYRMGATPTSR